MRKAVLDILNSGYYHDQLENEWKNRHLNEDEVNISRNLYIDNNITWEENEWIVIIIGRTNTPKNLWDEYFPLWTEEEYYYNWENDWFKIPHPANPKRK